MNLLPWMRWRRESAIVAWLLGEELSERTIRRVEALLCKRAAWRAFAVETARDLADVAEALGDPHALVDERLEWLRELQSARAQETVAEQVSVVSPHWGVWASVASGVAALIVLAMVWIAFPSLQQQSGIEAWDVLAETRQDRRSRAVAEYEEPVPVGLFDDGMTMYAEPGSNDSDTGFRVESGQIMRKEAGSGAIPAPKLARSIDFPRAAAPASHAQPSAPVSQPQSSVSPSSLGTGLGGMEPRRASEKQEMSPADSRPAVRGSQPRRLAVAGKSSRQASSDSSAVGDRAGDIAGKKKQNEYYARDNKDSGEWEQSAARLSADQRKPDSSTIEHGMSMGYMALKLSSGIDSIELAEEKARSLEDADAYRPAEPLASSHIQLLSVLEHPFSTFSLNVSDASFLLTQSALRNGQLPDPRTIRQEEFYNAFDYRDPVANPELPVSFFAEVAQVPFLHNQQLVRFAVKTQSTGRAGTKPLRLTLVLDHSGSMTRVDRQQVLQAIASQLGQVMHPEDRWSLVTFAENVTVQQVDATVRGLHNLPQLLSRIPASGGTNIEQALIEGYQVARNTYSKDAYNRVVLITDGAANLGTDLPDELAKIVESNRKDGIYFDAIGVGWDDYNDSLLERLARNGEGKYRFVDTPEEVAPLIQSLAGSFRPAARDVKVQVEWNRNQVERYRLIGYETHRLRDEDFRDDSVDAAEMARNEVGNALYLVETLPGGEGPLGTVRVRYKPMDEERSRELAWILPEAVTIDLDASSPSMQLASAAAFFAEMLMDARRYPELTLEQLERWLTVPRQEYSDNKKIQELQQMIQQARGMIR